MPLSAQDYRQAGRGFQGRPPSIERSAVRPCDGPLAVDVDHILAVGIATTVAGVLLALRMGSTD